MAQAHTNPESMKRRGGRIWVWSFGRSCIRRRFSRKNECRISGSGAKVGRCSTKYDASTVNSSNAEVNGDGDVEEFFSIDSSSGGAQRPRRQESQDDELIVKNVAQKATRGRPNL